MKANFLNAINKINIAKKICNQLLGNEHHVAQRIGLGLVIMAVGVVLAKASSGCNSEFLEYTGDCVGYGLHGVGLTPIIESMLAAAE